MTRLNELENFNNVNETNNNEAWLRRCPPIDLEFSDLTYSVPVGRNETKLILRGVSGLFHNSQLTAIMGASGAGKSTLLNVLAAYRTGCSGGTVYINGACRDDPIRFRKFSRYIMQEDLLQPNMTAMESLEIAAHLKLGNALSSKQKYANIEEILNRLRLTKAKDTLTSSLSGGEKKRLSIALELLNNPPILFLDEPTTGLDDVSSHQCVSLLKMLSNSGHNVICSIHTPSARIFSMFDQVYILSGGQCVFAGPANNVVSYLASFGLHCPLHYNPADFVIEVSSGDYGDYTEKMVAVTQNGRRYAQSKCPRSDGCPNDVNNVGKQPPSTKITNASRKYEMDYGQEDKLLKTNSGLPYELYEFNSSGWYQFRILFYRMMLQTWRDRSYVLLKAVMYTFTGLMIGSMYFKMGNDATKTLFNFGFCFVTNIVLMYIPMLPILLNFPSEVLLLKREYFNRWYGFNSFFIAHTVSRMPIQFFLCMFYIIITYVMTDQPMELYRAVMFTVICLYIAIVSESLAYAISAHLNVVNSIFVGPALSVPFMLLAVYGLGTGSDNIPIVIHIAMYFSYLRYGLEGLVVAIYGYDRPKIYCPLHYCELRYPDKLLRQVGMENVNFWLDVLALTFIFFLFKLICYVLLKRRLSTVRSALAFSFIGRFVKTYFTLTR